MGSPTLVPVPCEFDVLDLFEAEPGRARASEITSAWAVGSGTVSPAVCPSLLTAPPLIRA